ncbi:hypothetical protein HPB52_015565 [Rhipicephalus sanguineus]|uniref:Uncharacterized protein n=1 Tax=Rhipicephalus sanguineus TaxID=34632 RepID=A0A9D4PEL5_RHISA|nr:hypothetical protein HPB52_015565 [Rhipicephalus sanguineus]
MSNSPVLFSRACVECDGEPLIGKHSELRNTVIRAACIDLPHLRPADKKPSCNSYETDMIFDAMNIYNVTVDVTFYSSSIRLAGDMFKGLIDVHRNLAAANPTGATDFHTPGLITCWYESFYAKRKGPEMLSLYDIWKDSKLAVTLVAIALVLSLAFFVFADAHRVRYCSANELSNSFMFLLASFYSTSYSLPRIVRWSGLAGLVCGLWLIGMLPFSNYFRGELTSRVTLRAFPEHMDTLTKLERALDEHKVAPCVVKDTFLHERLTKNGSMGNIHRKLRLAFEKQKEKKKLVKSSYNHCLRCAVREDLVCYLFSLPPWYNHPYKRMIIETKEHLSPILLTITVRRNYPHKTGLSELIRKILEAGLMRPPENTRRNSHLRNFDERDSPELSPLKLEELASFLFLYMTLLAAAVLVFALEMTTQASKALTEALAVHA